MALLTVEAVCAQLGLAEVPRGLPLIRINQRTVRYHPDDVDAWARGERPKPPPRPRQKPDWQRVEGRVYFIADDEESPVKVGWTTGDVACRLVDIQVGCWVPLRVHASFECFRWEESWMHGKLSEHRIRGEWFDRVPTLAYMDELIALWCPDGASKSVSPAVGRIPSHVSQAKSVGAPSGEKTVIAGNS